MTTSNWCDPCGTTHVNGKACDYAPPARPVSQMGVKRLREIMAVMRLSRVDLAELLGLSDGTVSGMLSGRVNIRPVVALAVLYLYEHRVKSTPCPVCGGPMVPLRSQNSKICNDCKLETPWTLAPNQKSLLGNNRQDRTK